ncbi:MAG: 50S ribosomal protein L19e, partial [archaeon]|nr:50S ribosomal protein L19e [archaeon]
MNLTTQKRLAASILKVGVNCVWIDPNEIEEVSRAITRDGVRQLIDQGIIKAKPQTGISSYRSKKLKEQ